MGYRIFADSACDIKPEILSEWGVSSLKLTFRFEGGEELFEGDMTEADFYAKMRNGGVAKTAAINSETFRAAFAEALSGGEDVLYLGFSSGLSSTYNAARIACDSLRSEYPERTLIALDTLCASAGYGLLLYLTAQKKREGASLAQAAEFAEATKFSVCHWFTVEDLVYLKRGGRISSTAAFVGNMLGIKPVLHMDNEGHLVSVAKVRGRRTSVEALADKYGELAVDPSGGTVFISHGDCADDVERLKASLERRYSAHVMLTADIGTVIGSHSGPGTIAVFFIGKER